VVGEGWPKAGVRGLMQVEGGRPSPPNPLSHFRARGEDIKPSG